MPATVIEASLATVKAELSRYVDEAEHRGRRIVITRHGKPAAVLVPVSVGLQQTTRRPQMTKKAALAFLQSFAEVGDSSVSAVDDLTASRR